MWRQLIIYSLSALFFSSDASLSQTIDPHRVFEERCSRCHTRHGGQFTRKALTFKPDGTIVGRKTNEPVQSFLKGHSGKPSHQEIAALVDMFTIQLQSGGLYQQKCRICHDSARKLAHTRLEMRDARLTGWMKARDIRDFLSEHGRLEANEVEIITRLLIWQLRITGR